MKVQTLRSILIEGEHVEAGTVVEVGEELAATLFLIGKAEIYQEPPKAKAKPKVEPEA